MKNLLSILSITIATTALLSFLALQNGIEQASFSDLESRNPLTQITVQPPNNAGLMNILGRNQGSITPETIAAIADLSDVKAVYPELQFNNFASLEVDLLGFSLITDAMIFGVPEGFINNDLQNPKDWQRSTEPYPALIPTKILDLYNLAIANPKGLPQIDEESLLGKEITLYPNYSTLFRSGNTKSNALRLEVVGFSDKVNLLGATLPIDLIRQLNADYSEDQSENYLELFVEAKSAAAVPELAAEIEKLGFSTQYFQKNVQEVDAKLKYLRFTLQIISIIILLLAAIAIAATFLAKVAEQRRTIGLYRALGATRPQIRNLILSQALKIGSGSSITGITFGILLSIPLNNLEIQSLATLGTQQLFLVQPIQILRTLVFGILLTLLAAVIPAQKAASISPIEALK